MYVQVFNKVRISFFFYYKHRTIREYINLKYVHMETPFLLPSQKALVVVDLVTHCLVVVGHIAARSSGFAVHKRKSG